MLKNPDDGTYDCPDGTVRERVHCSIYASKNDGEHINDNTGKIDEVTRPRYRKLREIKPVEV